MVPAALFVLLCQAALFEAAVPNLIMWTFFMVTESSAIYQIWFVRHPESIGRKEGKKRSLETQMALEWLNSYLWFASVPMGMLMYIMMTVDFQPVFALFLAVLWASWWAAWYRGIFVHHMWKPWVVLVFVPFRGIELLGAIYCALGAYGFV
jgi:hypothetical protein